MQKSRSVLAAVCVLLLAPLAGAVTLPGLVNYQGYLTDADGEALNGSYDMAFAVYDAATGGTSYWGETRTGVEVSDGVFDVILGEVNPITNLPAGPDCYLEVTVGSDVIAPRVRLVSVPYSLNAGLAADAHKLEGLAASEFAAAGHAHDDDYVNVGQAAGGDLDGTYPDPTIAGLQGRPLAAAEPGDGQVLKWDGSAWTPQDDAVGGGGGDSYWTRSGDALYTVELLGIAKGGANSVLYGNQHHTHVNLGVGSTTGANGQNAQYATVGGGDQNTASGGAATVGGGQANVAGHSAATVGGGLGNTASGGSSTIGGGDFNTASYWNATVSGGSENIASGAYAAIAGGDYNTAGGAGAFAAGIESEADHYNSVALNGTVTTASGQTSVGTLSKASGTFTIDHPLDPHGKILNHYFIEGPEMRNIYDGEAKLDAAGRAVVNLPDYFDALNRNPRVQLTGVGSYEVFLAEEVSGNRFAIGGPAGTKVYWQVTGERKDISAEVTRRIVPVEQRKTGKLADRMLDDEFLSSCMDQLEREGNAHGIDFRTAAGRARYERMRERLRKAESR